MKIDFKPKFIERYRNILGEELETFLEFCLKPLRRSIRINTLKISKEEFLERARGWDLKRIPWIEFGFWVIRPEYEIGNTLEHQLGYFYVQEAASMVPPIVLDPKKGEFVLDLCASPGSKTTQMAQMMENKGIIVANDLTIERMKPLISNLQRCGVLNTVVTREDGRIFSRKVKQKFDKVLVDAPCSATGAIRRNMEIVRMWNPNMIRGLSKLQKALIVSGFDCLKSGGTLVYSTCTLEPEENEEVVDHLLKVRDNAELEKIKVDNLKSRKGLTEWNGKKFENTLKRTIRIYPQDNDTEGFFVAKVVKE